MWADLTLQADLFKLFVCPGRNASWGQKTTIVVKLSLPLCFSSLAEDAFTGNRAGAALSQDKSSWFITILRCY